MATQFKLPEISEGVESADVAEITVSVGDVIEADAVVLEVETEKAVVEIRCPHAGKITEIHVEQGQTIPIGEPVLTIEPADEPSEKDDKAEKVEEKPKSSPERSEEKSEKKQVEDKPVQKEQAKAEPEKAQPKKKEEPQDEEKQPSASQPATSSSAAARSSTPADTSDENEDNGEKDDDIPIPAGPATRRLARELGVDLHDVEGSGPGGRVTQEDVKFYVKTAMKSGGAAPAATAAPGRQIPALPDFSEFGEIERQKLSRLAQTSANQLSLSWQMIPHVTQHDLADITELETARKKFMDTSGKGGPKVTMTAAAVKAVVTMLKAFPEFNSSLDAQTNELVLKHYYHIGVAVDTEAGLVVPVIRDADHKTILQIAEELATLAQKARDRKLDMKEMQGGSFTITNLGGIGGTYFTPIVNYPEVAILGMSRSRWQMEVINGQPTPRLMLPLSLSYDHRVINGADAARFISRLSVLMSDAFRFLIET